MVAAKQSNSHHKTPVHTIRKRHLDAMLSPYNTRHCSTEILWFPTCHLYIPVAFPINRKRRLEGHLVLGIADYPAIWICTLF